MMSLHPSAHLLLGLIDLTSLNEDDTAERIESLCHLAAGPLGPPAALCVYPEYVLHARRCLDVQGLSSVPVASVANFPDGGADATKVSRECRRLRSVGADEVDVVLPYRSLQSGDEATFIAVAEAAREAVGEGVLKCILETGLLTDSQIDRACELALGAGADFLKTSTGKAQAHASLPAARRLLEAAQGSKRPAGVKVAGGIGSLEQAQAYLALAQQILGEAANHASRFRIGASALYNVVLDELGGVHRRGPPTPSD